MIRCYPESLIKKTGDTGSIVTKVVNFYLIQISFLPTLVSVIIFKSMNHSLDPFAEKLLSTSIN